LTGKTGAGLVRGAINGVHAEALFAGPAPDALADLLERDDGHHEEDREPPSTGLALEGLLGALLRTPEPAFGDGPPQDLEAENDEHASIVADRRPLFRSDVSGSRLQCCIGAADGDVMDRGVTVGTATVPGASLRGRLESALAVSTARLSIVLVAVLPFHLYFPLTPDAGPVDGVLMSLQDMVLIAVALGAMARMVSAGPMRAAAGVDPIARSLLVFVGAVGVAFVGSPSDRGIMAVLRLVGVVALVDVWRRDASVWRRAADVFVIACSVEAVLMIVQRLLGQAIGLAPFEAESPFLSLAVDFPTPLGTTGHPYHAGSITAIGLVVACWSLMRTRRRWLFGAAALLSFATIQSSSRMLVLVVFAIVIVLVVHAGLRDRASRAGLVAVIALPAVVWLVTMTGSFQRPVAKGTEVASSTIDANGRGGLADQAITIWRSDPLLGVGPGGYVEAQRAMGLPQLGAWPIVVHNFGLQVLSETGVIGVAALLGSFGSILWRCRRRLGSFALPLAAIVPMALLDHILWTYGFALVLLAIAFVVATSDAADAVHDC
jgi:O-antigen ligase